MVFWWVSFQSSHRSGTCMLIGRTPIKLKNSTSTYLKLKQFWQHLLKLIFQAEWCTVRPTFGCSFLLRLNQLLFNLIIYSCVLLIFFIEFAVLTPLFVLSCKKNETMFVKNRIGFQIFVSVWWNCTANQPENWYIHSVSRYTHNRSDVISQNTPFAQEHVSVPV